MRLKPISFLETPLSLSLLQPSILPRMGYLTMNRTRKLVPLLEGDDNLRTIPIVGLWVTGCSSVDHPFVWAACVRYMVNESLADRVFVQAGTFLLACISNGSYYEV